MIRCSDDEMTRRARRTAPGGFFLWKLTLISFVALVGLSLARQAAAQAPRPLEISTGYVYVRDTTVDVTFPAGWSIGVSKGLGNWLSIAAAYDDGRKTIPSVAGDLTLGVRTIVAGGQASARVGRATEFGQLLFGVVHATGDAFGVSEASTHACVQAGAGLDYPLTRKVAFRVELDYRVFFSRTSDLGRQVRALTGVVLTVF
jgi:hypothetical protein